MNGSKNRIYYFIKSFHQINQFLLLVYLLYYIILVVREIHIFQLFNMVSTDRYFYIYNLYDFQLISLRLNFKSISL